MTNARDQICNPILPNWEYVPDVEPRVFHGRLYLYGSHDRFGGGDFCLNDYVGWSAPLERLADWQYEGVIYRAEQDPLNTDGKQCLFAPDLVRGADDRYYLFYCLSRTSVVSVAVSDTPAGKFTFYGHIHHPDGTLFGIQPGDPFCFDPGVLLDSDGQAWLYVGFGSSGMMREMMKKGGILADGSYCVRLAKDFLTVESVPVLVIPGIEAATGTGYEGHAFYEASSPRNISGRYYLIYSSEKSHELCYAVSNRPDGDFVYGGTIVSNGDVGFQGRETAINYTGNIHGGLERIDGRWCVFYHRQTNLRHFSRQCCAEPIVILPDGTIPQVEMTSCGLNRGPFAGTGTYGAYIACNLSSAKGTYLYGREFAQDLTHPYFTQTGPDREGSGDQYIANLQNGAWVGFKYFALGEAKQISVRVRGSFDGVIAVSTELGGAPAAQIHVAAGEGWREWSGPFHVNDGTFALYFICKGTGKLDFCSFTLA